MPETFKSINHELPDTSLPIVCTRNAIYFGQTKIADIAKSIFKYRLKFLPEFKNDLLIEDGVFYSLLKPIYSKRKKAKPFTKKVFAQTRNIKVSKHAPAFPILFTSMLHSYLATNLNLHKLSKLKENPFPQ